MKFDSSCIWCKLALLTTIILIFTTTDLVVKDIATKELKNKPDIVVIENFWYFKYTENRDIGFSILTWLEHFLDKTQKWIFLICIQSLGAIFVGWLYFSSKQIILLLPLGLIISGALGNIINRVMNGYVVDYIFWFSDKLNFYWPIFNLADTFTVIGASILFIVLIFFKDKVNIDILEKKPKVDIDEINSEYGVITGIRLYRWLNKNVYNDPVKLAKKYKITKKTSENIVIDKKTKVIERIYQKNKSFKMVKTYHFLKKYSDSRINYSTFFRIIKKIPLICRMKKVKIMMISVKG